MQILYHYPLCPLSRQARIYLKEFGQECSLAQEAYWKRRDEFIKINPAGTVPVLKLNAENDIIGIYAITEYFSENQEDFYLMPEDKLERAKIRYYISWFNEKFNREVSKIFIDEKIIRLLMNSGEPRSNFIMIAKSNLIQHLKFLTNLLEQNTYIISDKITCVDIVAASHISIIDYFGEINWDRWNLLKEWYSIIKSRPSFQPVLQDYIPGFPPAKDYANLDF